MTQPHVRSWALLLLALVSTGCTQQHSASQPVPPAADVAAAPASEAAARAAFDQYVNAFWSDGDTAAIERAVSPTMIYHYNGIVVPSDFGKHREALRNFRGLFPDLTAVTDVYTGHGAQWAAATTWTGTYSGTIRGKKSTEPSTWSVNYIFRVENDRIVELWETWDEGGLLTKLGIGPGACDA